jgi:hypothetical protein
LQPPCIFSGSPSASGVPIRLDDTPPPSGLFCACNLIVPQPSPDSKHAMQSCGGSSFNCRPISAISQPRIRRCSIAPSWRRSDSPPAIANSPRSSAHPYGPQPARGARAVSAPHARVLR